MADGASILNRFGTVPPPETYGQVIVVAVVATRALWLEINASISPVEVSGDSASNAAVFVVFAVPPFAMGKAPVTFVVRSILPASMELVTTPVAMVVAFPTLVTLPVRFALVVTVPAVKPAAVPLIFVPTNALGVPSAGVISVGLVSMTNLDPVPVCEATDVVLPDEVIGPVKFAFVVTVAAFPVVDPEVPETFPVTLPVTAPTNVEAVTDPVKVGDAIGARSPSAVFKSVCAERVPVIEPQVPPPPPTLVHAVPL